MADAPHDLAPAEDPAERVRLLPQHRRAAHTAAIGRIVSDLQNDGGEQPGDRAYSPAQRAVLTQRLTAIAAYINSCGT